MPQASLNAGCAVFFSKPCLPTDLASALRHVLFGAEIAAR